MRRRTIPADSSSRSRWDKTLELRWGSPVVSDAQKEYAASDVRHLHAMRTELDKRLAREGRADLARACFDFLPHRAELDLAGWPEIDIFAHA